MQWNRARRGSFLSIQFPVWRRGKEEQISIQLDGDACRRPGRIQISMPCQLPLIEMSGSSTTALGFNKTDQVLFKSNQDSPMKTGVVEADL